MLPKLGRPGGPSTYHLPKLVSFVDKTKIQAPPFAFDLKGPASLPMWGNDRWGDCTCATWAGVFVHDAAVHGQSISFSTDEVEKMYRASGWDGTDATDRGWMMDKAALYAQEVGLRDTAGVLHKSSGGLYIRHTDHFEVRIGLRMLGAMPVGARLPIAAQRQTVWDTDGQDTPEQKPGSWGGHSMTLVSYDRTGGRFRTWGRLQRFTWAWWDRYVDEAVGKIDPLWVSGERPAPGGFLLTDAQEAVRQLRA